MCLNPKSRLTSSSYVNTHGSNCSITYKCGKCAECRNEKKNEWTIRNLAEYKDTKRKGGYVIALVLTYAPDKAPYFFNPMKIDGNYTRCFSREHIQNLKHDMDSMFYFSGRSTLSEDFKYFIASEYGGLNHNPHYHCLFFDKIGQFTPMQLRDIVASCWPYGHVSELDGVQGFVVDGRGIMDYTSKYVCKDDEFSEEIEVQLSLLKSSLGYAKFNKQFPKETLRNLMPFHLQSCHFGECALEDGIFYPMYAKQTIFEKGCFTIEDREKIMVDIPLPLYFYRKLYCHVEKDDHRTVEVKRKLKSGEIKKARIPAMRYVIDPLGKEFLLKHQHELLDKNTKKLEELISNSGGMECLQNENSGDYVQLKKQLFDLLDGRPLRDYVAYKMYFQGKCLFPNEELPDMYDMILAKHDHCQGEIVDFNKSHGFKDELKTCQDSEKTSIKRCCSLWRSPVYKDNILVFFDRSELTPQQTDILECYSNPVFSSSTRLFMKLEDYVQLTSINESRFSLFRGYDQITKIIDKFQNYKNAHLLEQYKKARDLKAQGKLVTEPHLVCYLKSAKGLQSKNQLAI